MGAKHEAAQEFADPDACVRESARNHKYMDARSRGGRRRGTAAWQCATQTPEECVVSVRDRTESYRARGVSELTSDVQRSPTFWDRTGGVQYVRHHLHLRILLF